MPHIMILDGNSLVNRAFYALPPLTSSEGLPTNAVHGFLTMLFKLYKEQKPDYWVVVFDKSKPTVRIEQYAGYKAQRKETPETLRPQFSYLKEILEVMSVPMLELAGYEADDIIATVADEACAADMDVSIYTGDRDALQLISDRTKVYLTKKGITDVECYDEQKLYERYQLKPEQIVDLKGLMGDASDNIPGIPGVGEKTALKLLHEYGTVDNVLEHKDAVAGNKLKSLLAEFADQAVLSRKLAAMIHDVPVHYSLEQLAWREPDRTEGLRILHRYSLHTIARLFEQAFHAAAGSTAPAAGAKKHAAGSKSEPQNKSITAQTGVLASGPCGGQQSLFALDEDEQPDAAPDEAGWLNLFKTWRACKAAVALSYRYEGPSSHGGKWTRISICDGDNAYTLDREQCSAAVIAAFYELLGDDGVSKTTADCKTLYTLLLNDGATLNGLALDLSLAAYLLNPGRGNYAAADLLREYTDDLFATLEPAREALLIGKLAPQYLENLEQAGLTALLTDIEQPLSRILAEMEQHGIGVDQSQLEEAGRELDMKIAVSELEIHALAGSSFNINSPQQLGKILFEDLGLTPRKKTKTGYSTDAETLEDMIDEHPLIEKLLEYRQLVKLNSTYVKGLLQQLTGGKIHTTFQQTVTATGRLSSTEPNLQNIPIRLEEGRKLRKVFKPTKDGWLLFSADYSQIELRILAHYSQDPILCHSFTIGEDVHARTASEVFGVPLGAVDSDMRRKAKAVNFGLMYGLTDFGLGRDLGIGRKEAKYYITQYFERYSGVERYLQDVVQQAKQTGEVKTLLNRLRKVPELFHPNHMRRQFGERIAKNTPIQGTAADIMKIAMIKAAAAIAGLRADLLLQVHDELLVQVHPDDVAETARKMKRAMEDAYRLDVPLVVDCKVGGNWYDMIPYKVES